MIAAVRGLLSGAILSGTPLLYATLAELIGQRAGVVNLGVEGVMLMGAVIAFAAMVHTGSAASAIAAGALAGALFNTIFAVLVLTPPGQQLASGLPLLLFRVGARAPCGGPYTRR